MTETVTQRYIRKLFSPAPMADTDALETIHEQAVTIRKQAAHIKALDERIVKLEAEIRDWKSLL